MTIEAALEPGGQLYVDKFNDDTGRLPIEVTAFMTAYSLRDASASVLTAQTQPSRSPSGVRYG